MREMYFRLSTVLTTRELSLTASWCCVPAIMTARSLKKLIRATVQRGTATSLYYGTSYKAGGKTGSAEFQNGSTDSHAWFVGYAEQDGKKLVVSIVVEAAGTGGRYAVPIAKKIFDAYW